MIPKNSRYYNGPLKQVVDSRSDKYTIYVSRKFPKNGYVSYIEYTWTDGDTLDAVAQVYFGDPEAWWVILDVNPDIHDGMNIAPGTKIRIPRG